MEIVIAGIVGLVIAVGGLLVLKAINAKNAKQLIEAADKEGEQIKRDKIHQAKEKFFQLKSEHEKTVNKKTKRLEKLKTNSNKRKTV